MQGKQQPETNSLNKEGIEQVVDLLHALTHPVRLHIVQLLDWQADRNVGEIAQAIQLDQSTVSLHLRYLFNTGIVSRDRRNGYTYYYNNPDRLADIAEVLKGFQ